VVASAAARAKLAIHNPSKHASRVVVAYSAEPNGPEAGITARGPRSCRCSYGEGRYIPMREAALTACGSLHARKLPPRPSHLLPTANGNDSASPRMGGRPSRGTSNNGRISLSDTVMPLMSFRAAAGARPLTPPRCHQAGGRGQRAGRLDAWYEFLLRSMIIIMANVKKRSISLMPTSTA
jgi:hypothetical protein